MPTNAYEQTIAEVRSRMEKSMECPWVDDMSAKNLTDSVRRAQSEGLHKAICIGFSEMQPTDEMDRQAMEFFLRKVGAKIDLNTPVESIAAIYKSLTSGQLNSFQITGGKGEQDLIQIYKPPALFYKMVGPEDRRYPQFESILLETNMQGVNLLISGPAIHKDTSTPHYGFQIGIVMEI